MICASKPQAPKRSRANKPRGFAPNSGIVSV
jgi:hypothetical protein